MRCPCKSPAWAWHTKTGVSSPDAEQGFNDVKVVNGVKDNQEFLHEQHDFFYNREALTRKTVVVNGVTRV